MVAVVKGSPIQLLRVVGLTEGVSFLVLLGIAMPLKWIWGKPMAVTVVGWAHGVLIILLGIVAAICWRMAKWPIRRPARVMIAALIPFGPFMIDRQLREWDREYQEGSAAKAQRDRGSA